MKLKKLVDNNKSALRWCKTRRAKIIFEDYKNEIICGIYLGKRVKYGATLIKTVNEWIKYFNKEKE